jgi:hypothetical protein
MNRNPGVRKYFPGLLTPEESLGEMLRIEQHWDTHGFGPWALEWAISEQLGRTERDRGLSPQRPKPSPLEKQKNAGVLKGVSVSGIRPFVVTAYAHLTFEHIAQQNKPASCQRWGLALCR